MTINTPLNSQIPTLRKLWQEAFGDTEEFLNTFFSTAFLTDHCRCVTADEKVAAALYWFDCLYADKPIAYIYAVATAKAFQGQGICHKLMEDTHRHLEKSGYQGAILVPGSEELFYFYEKIGYKTCSQIRKFHCTAIQKDISLTQIDQREIGRAHV